MPSDTTSRGEPCYLGSALMTRNHSFTEANLPPGSSHPEGHMKELESLEV